MQEAPFSYNRRDPDGGQVTVRGEDFDKFFENLGLAFGTATAAAMLTAWSTGGSVGQSSPAQQPVPPAPAPQGPPQGQAAPPPQQQVAPPPPAPQAPAELKPLTPIPAGSQMGAPCTKTTKAGQPCGYQTFWQPPGFRVDNNEPYDGYWRCPNAGNHAGRRS